MIQKFCLNILFPLRIYFIGWGMFILFQFRFSYVFGFWLVEIFECCNILKRFNEYNTCLACWQICLHCVKNRIFNLWIRYFHVVMLSDLYRYINWISPCYDHCIRHFICFRYAQTGFKHTTLLYVFLCWLWGLLHLRLILFALPLCTLNLTLWFHYWVFWVHSYSIPFCDDTFHVSNSFYSW